MAIHSVSNPMNERDMWLFEDDNSSTTRGVFKRALWDVYDQLMVLTLSFFLMISHGMTGLYMDLESSSPFEVMIRVVFLFGNFWKMGHFKCQIRSYLISILMIEDRCVLKFEIDDENMFQGGRFFPPEKYEILWSE